MADSGRIHNAPASLKSKVWKKFWFYLKNGVLDKSVAICTDCKTAIKYSASTTNLHNHLVRRHGETGEEEEASTASTKIPTGIQDLFQPKLTHNSAIAKVITRFIVKDMRPYSVVENDGFRDMIKTLEPRYTIPTRQHFTNKCLPECTTKLRMKSKNSYPKQNKWQLPPMPGHHVPLTPTWQSQRTISLPTGSWGVMFYKPRYSTSHTQEKHRCFIKRSMYWVEHCT